jgi:hypothetical protein
MGDIKPNPVKRHKVYATQIGNKTFEQQLSVSLKNAT